MTSNKEKDETIDLPVVVRDIAGASAPTVSARTLHRALTIGNNFARWWTEKRASHGLEGGSHFEPTRAQKGSRIDYAIRLASAERIVARSRGHRAAAVGQHLATADHVHERITDTDPRETTWIFPEVHLHIVSGRTIQVVDLRDLHACLGAKTSYVDWEERRIKTYDLRQGRELFITPANPRPAERPEKLTSEEFRPTKRPGNVTSDEFRPTERPRPRTVVTLSAAKELAMVENNAIGRAIRAYFIACEERLLAIAPSAAAEETARLSETLARLGTGRPGPTTGTNLGPAEATVPLSVVNRLVELERELALVRRDARTTVDAPADDAPRAASPGDRSSGIEPKQAANDDKAKAAQGSPMEPRPAREALPQRPNPELASRDRLAAPLRKTQTRSPTKPRNPDKPKVIPPRGPRAGTTRNKPITLKTFFRDRCMRMSEPTKPRDNPIKPGNPLWHDLVGCLDIMRDYDPNEPRPPEPQPKKRH